MKEVKELMRGARNRAPNHPHAMKPYGYSWAIHLALSVQVSKMRKKNLSLPYLCPRGLTSCFDEATSPTKESSSHTWSTDKKKKKNEVFAPRPPEGGDSLGQEWGWGVYILTGLQVIVMWELWPTLGACYTTTVATALEIHPVPYSSWDALQSRPALWWCQPNAHVLLSQKRFISLSHFTFQTLTPGELSQSSWSLCSFSCGKGSSGDKQEACRALRWRGSP